MSTQEESRAAHTYKVVEPHLRPRQERRTARVILIDDAERTLLFEDTDPGIPGVTWWMTPGGGIDPGETELQAARREVIEETGLVLDWAALIGPVARRTVVHGYSDLVIEQEECFYLARAQAFEVDISNHTEDEKLTVQTHRWWTRAELAQTQAWIWPGNLVDLWSMIDGDPAGWPVDLGRIEESVVPDVIGRVC